MAYAMVPAEQAVTRGRRWPMTRRAWEALDAEVVRLVEEVERNDGYVTGRLDGEPDAPTLIPNVAGQRLRRQLDTAREVLAAAEVVDAPRSAIIGRRVTLEDGDGRTEYELVIPGAGDRERGAVAADSPVGRAILGARVGDEVTIQAPAGSWSAVVAAIE